jgi:hypothetical protein
MSSIRTIASSGLSRMPFLGRSVVGEQHEDRVVELVERPQPLHEAADLVVGVVEEGGERLLKPCREQLLVLGQLVPRVDPGVARCEFGALRDDPEFELAFVPPRPDDVPPFVVTAAVLLEVLRRRLMRRVCCAERHVEEKRSVGSDAAGVRHHPERLVDEIFGDVISVVRTRRWIDRVVVADELGMELVGLTFEEAVEAIESLAERPVLERAGGGALLHRRQVPLARAEGGVPLVAQHLRHRRRVVRDVAEHVGKAGAEVRHGAHADGMLRTPGEQ